MPVCPRCADTAYMPRNLSVQWKVHSAITNVQAGPKHRTLRDQFQRLNLQYREVIPAVKVQAPLGFRSKSEISSTDTLPDYSLSQGQNTRCSMQRRKLVGCRQGTKPDHTYHTRAGFTNTA